MNRENLSALLRDTIRMLCKSSLYEDTGMTIEGLLGVTLSNNEVFLININETVSQFNVVKPALSKPRKSQKPRRCPPKLTKHIPELTDMPSLPQTSSPLVITSPGYSEEIIPHNGVISPEEHIRHSQSPECKKQKTSHPGYDVQPIENFTELNLDKFTATNLDAFTTHNVDPFNELTSDKIQVQCRGKVSPANSTTSAGAVVEMHSDAEPEISLKNIKKEVPASYENLLAKDTISSINTNPFPYEGGPVLESIEPDNSFDVSMNSSLEATPGFYSMAETAELIKAEETSAIYSSGQAPKPRAKRLHGCTLCPYKSARFYNLKRHMLSVHATIACETPRSYACSVRSCEFNTFKEFEFRDHVLTCHPEICHRCKLCEEHFIEKKLLELHKRTVHSHNNKNGEFNSENKLSDGMESVEPTVKTEIEEDESFEIATPMEDDDAGNVSAKSSPSDVLATGIEPNSRSDLLQDVERDEHQSMFKVVDRLDSSTVINVPDHDNSLSPSKYSDEESSSSSPFKVVERDPEDSLCDVDEGNTSPLLLPTIVEDYSP